MQRGTPVRNPHTSTSDLLTWSETPPPESPATASSAARSRQVHCLSTLSSLSLSLFLALTFSLTAFTSQPSDRISKVLHGDQVTDEEAQMLTKRYNTRTFISYYLLCSQLISDLLVLFSFSSFLRSALKLVGADLFVNL